MKLKIEELTVEAFVPFGEVIEQPARAPDANGQGWTWWGENHIMIGGNRHYAIGYLDLQPAELSFDWAERHMHSDELLIPMGGDCLVYVGPPDNPEEPDRLPPLERFRVFRLREGQGVLLGKGVWHGAPMALDKPLNVTVLLLKETGKLDGHVVRFEETPVQIER
jgi:Ureidoglycolate hydrolase